MTVKSTGCGFDPYSRKINVYLHLYFHFFALMSRPLNTQCLPMPKLGGKWRTECLNTRFPFPRVGRGNLVLRLSAGYSVKLILLLVSNTKHGNCGFDSHYGNELLHFSILVYFGKQHMALDLD